MTSPLGRSVLDWALLLFGGVIIVIAVMRLLTEAGTHNKVFGALEFATGLTSIAVGTAQIRQRRRRP